MSPVIGAMLAALDLPALAELERALTLRLQPVATPAERRVAELGTLARLLAAETPGAFGQAPHVDRDTYDSYRGRLAPDAPEAETLAGRYGGWRRACRAAHGLLPDGRHTGPGMPWPAPSRGRQRARAYAREEIHAALRRCALALGRIPTSADYHWWSRETRRSLRTRGVLLQTSELPEHRIPGIEALYRHYPKGKNRFQQALANAALNTYEIALARTRRLLASIDLPQHPVAPLTALKALDENARRSCGIDDETALRISRDGFGWLPLSQATPIARALNASLDWIAGRTVTRDPAASPGGQLDLAVVANLTKQRAITAKQLCDALDLREGPYRRLLIKGSEELSLAEIAILASLCGVNMDDLLRN